MFIIILAIYTKDKKFVLNTFPRVTRVALKRVISDGYKSCIYSLKTVSASLWYQKWRLWGGGGQDRLGVALSRIFSSNHWVLLSSSKLLS